LELKEREEFKFEPLDLGIFYHIVLDALLKRLNKENKDFATIENGELLRILAEQIEQFVRTNSFISNFKRHSPHNAYIISSAAEVLEDCVLAIAQMVRAGSFRPRLSEVSFGRPGHSEPNGQSRDTLGKYELTLPDNRVLSLDGKIDRLDITNLGGEDIALVFDYKRRDTSFSWSKFYYGLDIQLPVYMLAVRNATGAKAKNVAGAFYMPVEVAPAIATLDKLSDVAEAFNYKAKGIFNGEFFQQLDSTASSGWSRFYNFRITKAGYQYGNYAISGALNPTDFEGVLRFAKRKIVQLAEEILSGGIDVRPYRLSGKSPCSYCKYKSVCRFDWQINDYNFLESVNKLQVIVKMGADNG